MRRRLSRALTILSIIILALALLVAGGDFLSRLGFEWRAPLTADSAIYLAIGRGILNGLVPYRDLFETKPPGIFFLSSLVLLMSRDASATGVVQALDLLSIPLILAWQAWRNGPSQRFDRIFIAAIALCFGFLLTIYIGKRSGEFQVESFGALFAILYLVAIAVPEHQKFTRTRFALATCGMLGAIGMKEPFLLTTFACALILCHRNPRNLLPRFVYPLAASALLGLATLTILGELVPFFTTYIPVMLGHFGGDSLIDRTFLVRQTYGDFVSFSPFLALLIIVFVVMAVRRTVMSAQQKQRQLFALICLLASIFVLTLAVRLGDAWYNHHNICAVPGYCAFFLLFLDTLSSFKPLARSVTINAVAVLLLAASLSLRPNVTYDRYPDERWAQKTAQDIDAVLTSCEQNRYLFIGGNGFQPYAYTTHSPLGPAFYQYPSYMNTHEFLTQTFMHNLQSAFLVVKETRAATPKPSSLVALSTHYLEKHYTINPPDCAAKTAGGFAEGSRLMFYYRKD